MYIRDEALQMLLHDVVTLASRLYGEDESTFSPETALVMDRWRDRCDQIINGHLTFDEAIQVWRKINTWGIDVYTNKKMK